MSTIEERVKKIVIEQLGVKEDEVTANASFVDDLGADSLDTVELVMALEEEFETEIPTKKPRRSPPCSRPSTTSRPTPRSDRSVTARRRAQHAVRPRSDTGSCATLAQFSFLHFATSDPVWCADARRTARMTWPR